MSHEQITAKVIEHSIRHDGKRHSRCEFWGELVTLQLQYPRFIHAEFMTHRVFSRNAASSRAIPVAKMIAQVRDNPAMPIHWGKNQPGMQAREEHDAPVALEIPMAFDNPSDEPLFTFDRTLLTAKEAWFEAASRAAQVAQAMSEAGYHKQVVNRLLEPFQLMQVVVTATEWNNFFELRAHPDAQPEIQALAVAMHQAMHASTPVYRPPENSVTADGWHLPYVSAQERADFERDPLKLARFSAARCARVSYLNHDGSNPNQEEDLKLFDRLVGSRPLHASPIEHQACALAGGWEQSNNFRGWEQFRWMFERVGGHAGLPK